MLPVPWRGHQSMLDGIELDIMELVRKFSLVPDEVLPEPALPQGLLTPGAGNFGPLT